MIPAAIPTPIFDQLSKGRLIFGVASGDRPVEYSVYDVPFESRDQSFRDIFALVQATTHKPENWDNQQSVHTRKVDLLPKCNAGDLPLFVTGNSRQSPEWIAEHATGWLMYPRQINHQTLVLSQWRTALQENDQPWKPFSQSLYIDLMENPDTPASPIHLGYRFGRNRLIEHLEQLRDIGVNHVTFNIRFSSRPVEDVLKELIEFVIPQFPKHTHLNND